MAAAASKKRADVDFRMESRWYFFPGQSERNTRVSDRAHALHVTSGAWAGITRHLERKKKVREALEREEAHREALKQGSRAMTKEWVNSIDNLRQKKEEERHDLINKKREDKIREYYRLRAEQEVVRKEYVDRIRREAFRTTSYPKQLTSALIQSETLYEREVQRQFNEQLRKDDQEVNKHFDAEILLADEKHKREDMDKKMKRLDKDREIGEVLRKQIKENEESKKAARRAHVDKETQERVNAAREEELLKQFEMEEKRRRRQEVAQGRKRAMENERRRQQMLAKENAEMELATRFYSEAKARIDCMMKTKEKEMRENAINAKMELAKKVAAVQESREAAENERIARVVSERDAEERAKAEQRAAFEAQAVKQRIEDRNKYFQRLQNEKNVENELKRWELLNRCKTAEVIEEYNQQNRREKWAKILEYRRELLEQMADDKEAKKREKEIDECMSRVSFEEMDKQFFEYANEVLELAKRKKRPTHPIEKVIQEYKKYHGLLPKETRCRCCRN